VQIVPIITFIVFNETQKYKGTNIQLGHVGYHAFAASAGSKMPASGSNNTNSFSEGKLDIVQSLYINWVCIQKSWT